MNFSIIVPHYNDLEGLNRLLSSLPKRNDIEIVVVDDNSNLEKNTFNDLATQYDFLNVRFFVNSTGVKGAGACRNLGLQKITGTYLLFADADDYFLENAFDVLDEQLLSAPGSDIYYFKPTSKCLMTGDLSDRHIRYADLVDGYLNNGDNEISARFRVPWSKLYLAKFVKENDCTFDEVMASNDVMFSIKTGFLAKKIQVVDDVIYCVTRGKGTLTVNKSKTNQVSRLLVAMKESEFIHKNKIPVEQDSLVGLIRDNIKFLDFKLFTMIVKNCFKGNLLLFPWSYSQYVKNPKLIIKRLTGKDKSSINDDKYT